MIQFVFDYEETLKRRVGIYAENLAEAIKEMHRRIDEEEIVLSAEDFAGGKISMPLDVGSAPRLELYGEGVKDTEGFGIMIDMW